MNTERRIRSAFKALRHELRLSDFQKNLFDGIVDGGSGGERTDEEALEQASRLIARYRELLWKLDLVQLYEDYERVIKAME